jgi:hypothetical protein
MGPPKTAKSVRNKWTSVCLELFLVWSWTDEWSLA